MTEGAERIESTSGVHYVTKLSIKRNGSMRNLLMYKMPPERVNQQVPARGPDREHSNVVEHQPLDRGDGLGLDRGQGGPDLDPGGPRRIGPVGEFDDEDGGAVGEGDGVRVECGQEVRVLDEPAFLPGAEVGQVVAGYGTEIRRVVASSHFCGVRSWGSEE